MKRSSTFIFPIIRLAILCSLILVGDSLSSQYICCPKFKIDAAEYCEDTAACTFSTPNQGKLARACKGASTIYTVNPLLPGYTYTWTVVGGTPASPTGNPMMITWGTGSSGSLKVVITGPGGTCKDSIQMSFCMLDAPSASFTMPDSVCAGTTVSFNNTSVGGSSFSWDFGDGSTYTGNNMSPTHTYNTPGTYIICLTAYSNSGSGSTAGKRCVECSDIFCDTILVKSGSGPDISLVGCKGSFCASSGDTTRFQTSSSCTPRTWSIPAGAGTILNPGGNPVQIIWNPAFVGNPTVNLTVPISCSGGCPASTSIIAPVIFPSLPINGPDPVCTNSTQTYSIAVLPGSYYSATLTNIPPCLASFTTGTNTFNSNTVDVNTGPVGGQFILQFTYYDSIKKCGGIARDTFNVKPKFRISPPAGNICDNSPFTLCANGSANWTIDSAGITVGSFSGVSCINLISFNPGIHIVTAVPTSPLIWCNASDRIAANILPNPILTALTKISDTLCKGSIRVHRVSTTIPATPFFWNITGSGNSILANDDTAVTVKWISPGMLSVFQNNPCMSNTIAFTVDTFKPPVISGPAGPHCEDDVVTYTVLPNNLPSYTYSVNKGSIVSQSGNTVTVIWAGSATPGHSISVTTCSGTSTLNVTVNQAATHTVSIVSYGCNSATITTSQAGAAPYQWYLNGVLQPLLTTQTVTVTSNGFWTCKPSGCYKNLGIAVNIPAPPVLTISTPYNLFCVTGASPMPSITIYSALSMGTPVTYQWYGPATNYAAPTAIAPAAGTAVNLVTGTPAQYGNYYLVVTYGAGCTVTSNTINIDSSCGGGLPCTLTPAFYNISSIGSTCSGSGKSFTANLSTAPPVGTTYNWSYGDGSTGSGNPSSHTYSLPGVYNVCVTVTSPGFCSAVACRLDTVILVPNFRIKQVCTGDSLFNTTQVLGGFTLTSLTWSASGGATMVGPLGSSPSFATGNGSITLTVVSGGCTSIITQAITTPSTSVAVTGLPIKACKNSLVTGITTTPAPSNYSSFVWNFGDATTSNIAPTSHAWNTTVGSPFTVSVNTINWIGCPATGFAVISIDTLPMLSLSMDTVICRGGTAILNASPTTLSSYMWYDDLGVSLGGPNTNPRSITTTGMYYVVGIDGNGCSGKSNNVSVVVKPLPKIKFDFPSGQTVCVSGFGGSTVISTICHPKYTYAWSSDDPTNISFSPTNGCNTFVSIASGASLGYHLIYLTVVDTSAPVSCPKTDTVCILLQRTPTVTISPGGPLCEGPPDTLIPNPNNPSVYTYSWTTGATTPTITVKNAGTYSVKIDSMGCSSNSNPVTINPKPNLELFPKGCDTMCDTAHLYIPLANIIGFPPPPSMYPSIVWLVDGIISIPGTYLYLNGLSLGNHNIQVIVTNIFGCIDTSRIYTVYVKKCDSIPCPPCIKDSCCNDFLDSMKNKTLGVNYVSSPTIVFTPPSGVIATDIIEWDFNCDGIVDMTSTGAGSVTYNYFSVGTYFACVKIIRIINTPTQKDTCFVRMVKKIVIEKQGTDDPCAYCQNLFVNVNIADDCAIAGDRMRTGFASGGSGIYSYRWYNLSGTLLMTGVNYGGPSPCYCVVTDNVTGCKDTSGVDFYNDIFGCVSNTTADPRCTNFKLVITKIDGPVTGDIVLTLNAGNGSGTYQYFWYGYAGGTGSPINSGGFVPGPTVVTPVLTSGIAATMVKVKDVTWGCEALDSFHLSDKVCKKNSLIFSSQQYQIKVYPNPTSSKLYVTSMNPTMLRNTSIQLFDISGRVMFHNEWSQVLKDRELNIENLHKGIYFLHIINDENQVIYYQKIVKQ